MSLLNHVGPWRRVTVGSGVLQLAQASSLPGGLCTRRDAGSSAEEVLS